MNTIGLEAERAAESFYLRRGARVLARRWQCKMGELDLVVDEGGVVVFVEVKSREGDFAAAEEAVSPSKRRKLTKTALLFAQTHGLGEMPMRFDVVAVQGLALRHLEDAFPREGWAP